MKLHSAREAAAHVMKEVESRGAYADLALDSFFRHRAMDPRERALATELVYGTARRLNTLDWLIASVSKKGLDRLDPMVLAILRTALYQFYFLDRVPAPAAADEAVTLARRLVNPGAAKFVNAVLRNVLRRHPEGIRFPSGSEAERLSLVHSHPLWLVRRWLERFGREGTEKLLQFNNTPPPVVLRTNTLKLSRDELIAELEAEGIKARPGRFAPEAVILERGVSVESLESFKKGHFFVQDESSMIPARGLDPRPGETAVDACAAPGGKATHLAQLMENRGKVLAVEIHAHRLSRLLENAERLGITIIEPIEGDARRLPEYATGTDAVLIDAPCSGTGVLRRRPDARWRKTPEGLKELTTVQREILAAAARSVRPGGRIVYSTCSLEAEENDAVVDAFLADHPDFAEDDLAPYLPEGLRGEVRSGRLLILPQVHGSDGFFIARLRHLG